MKCTYINCSNRIQPSNPYSLCRLHRRSHPILRAQEVERTKKWKQKNKAAHSAQQSRYRVKHTKELTEYYNKWLKDNWKDQMAYRYARKRRVKQATPLWADLRAIHDFYLKCPKGYHVDHIIPLNGKNISGLHVIDNLQYLPAIENLKKGNRAA